MEKSLFNGIILLFTLNKDFSTSLRYARNDKKLFFNAENHSQCYSECRCEQHLQRAWQ